ncbi:mitochondrial K+-H+ exchange-related-domain-containing protein [Pelagophyceae sp. CCMP2097]|nr:mitochondrial K+-H+ exchange-related-domain-containing protein [Pelagophyceae sp. CCMP2097]
MATLRILVFPTYRRHWTLYAVRVGCAQAPLRGHLNGLQKKLWDQFEAYWDRVMAPAEPRTLRAFVRGVALNVVEQVEPEERFLGAVHDASPLRGDVEVLYPSSMPKRLVRRRLRLVLNNQGRVHRVWKTVWGLLTPLMLPIVLSPFSNLQRAAPLVYTVWRWHSHRAAELGATALQAADASLTPVDDVDALAAELGCAEGAKCAVEHKCRWLKARGVIPDDVPSERNGTIS